MHMHESTRIYDSTGFTNWRVARLLGALHGCMPLFAQYCDNNERTGFSSLPAGGPLHSFIIAQYQGALMAQYQGYGEVIVWH